MQRSASLLHVQVDDVSSGQNPLHNPGLVMRSQAAGAE